MEQKKKSRVNILVCCHKPGKWLSDDVYMPIQCGKTISDVDLGIQGDNTGDNISAKNPYYCELTAMCWAWKNLKDVDYIGLCHYRRYFVRHNKFSLFKPSLYFAQSVDEIKTSILSQKDLKNTLSKYDVITASSIYQPYNLRTEYSYMLNSMDYKILKQAIADLYPNYIPSFEKVMFYGNKYSAYNMFVMKWSVYEDYCRWLFSILEDVEKRINLDYYTDYYKRSYGYMAERLLNIYIIKNGLKTKRLPACFIGKSKSKLYYMKNMLRNVRHRISFVFNKPLGRESIS